MTNGRPRSRGWTYLLLLWWVAISAVMLLAIARSWVMESQRQREKELVFRGEQIRTALQAYRESVPGNSDYPQDLLDLLEDRRGPLLKRHLRQLWSDPITGQTDWGLVKNTQKGIVGVYSLSEREPLAAPQGVKSYREWQFIAGANTH